MTYKDKIEQLEQDIATLRKMCWFKNKNYYMVQLCINDAIQCLELIKCTAGEDLNQPLTK